MTCPTCHRSTPDGEVCARCHEHDVAARPEPGPIPTITGPHRSRPAALDCLAEARATLAAVVPAAEVCTVPAHLPFTAWLAACDACPCPLHSPKGTR